MTKRRKNDLETTVVLFSEESIPSFEQAEKLFYANEKAKNRTKRTIEWHRENLHCFKKAMSEQNIELDFKKINSRVIKNNFVLYAIDSWGNKPQTVNMRLRTLKQLYGYLVAEGYLYENPVSLVDPLKTPKTLIQSLSHDQVKKLLQIPDRQTFTGLRDYAVMIMLLDTGLRVSEICGLTLDSIDFNEGYIKVIGKGVKERIVPLQGKLKKVLKQYLFHRGNDIDHRYVFVTVDNNPLSKRSIQERLEIISKKAGINVRTSPHTWRHTFARMYIMNGGDIFSLKQILGHSSWEMVHKYVNLFGSDVSSQHLKASPVNRLEDN
ncbi:hypothetical protein N752_01590 [Desulforamulus aquiferis]|nr:tyrosine-type recombinase/integrase [Desulforamulus aquiferis]RYD06846.1 hypothetical protein N752_01590 [Desulforamulus aquiferis]